MKKIKNNSIESASLILFIVSISASVINYLVQIISGRLLSVEDFGTFNLLLSAITVCTVLATTMKTLVAKYTAAYSNKEADRIPTMLTTAIKYTHKIVVAIIGVGILFVSVFGGSMNRTAAYISVLIIGSLYYHYMVSGLAQGFQYFFIFPLINFLLSFVKLIGVVLSGMLLTGSDVRLDIIMAFMLLGAWVGTGVGYFLIQRKNKYINDFTKKGKDTDNSFELRIVAATFIANLCIIIMQNIDVFLIRSFFDGETVGLYSSAMLFGRILFFAVTSIGAAMFPLVINCNAKERKLVYFKSLTYCILLMSAFALPLAAFPRFLIGTLFGEKYLPALPYILYPCLIGGTTALNMLNMNFCIAIGKTKFLILSNVTGCMLCAALGMAFHASVQRLLINIFVVLMITFVINFMFIIHGLTQESKRG